VLCVSDFNLINIPSLSKWPCLKGLLTNKAMSKEWPALGQEKISRKKFQPRVGSFAAAVKVTNSVAEPSQERTDVKLGNSEKNSGQQACQSLSWEERNAANRAAKLAQKEEKKIKREENARRQLLAPKGYPLI
jgi:hypothetical protein